MPIHKTYADTIVDNCRTRARDLLDYAYKKNAKRTTVSLQCTPWAIVVLQISNITSIHISPNDNMTGR